MWTEVLKTVRLAMRSRGSVARVAACIATLTVAVVVLCALGLTS